MHQPIDAHAMVFREPDPNACNRTGCTNRGSHRLALEWWPEHSHDADGNRKTPGEAVLAVKVCLDHSLDEDENDQIIIRSYPWLCHMSATHGWETPAMDKINVRWLTIH